MAKKNGTNPTKGMRKLGERVEKVSEKLSPMQIEDARAKVCELVRERDELKAKKKTVVSDFKAKLDDVDGQIQEQLGAVSTARRTREVTIEEWVSDKNEVIRIDKVTREELGRRNATAAEAQEELPLEKDGDDELDDEVKADAAEAGDFGDKE